MLRRAAAGVLFPFLALAQFNGLATNADGRRVWFCSSLSLQGATSYNWEKLFTASQSGVTLEAVDHPQTQFFNRFATSPYRYVRAEASADGAVVAATLLEDCAANCGEMFETALFQSSGTAHYNGKLRLSPNGKHALSLVHDHANVATLTYLDLSTGKGTVILSQPAFLSIDAAARLIADDGTAVFQSGANAYLSRRGAAPELLGAVTIFGIDAAAARILYAQNGQVFCRILETGTQTPAGSGEMAVMGMSDDGRRMLWLSGGIAYVAGTDGADSQPVAAAIEPVTAATLSGDGQVAWLVTTAGRLLKVTIANGAVEEFVGRTFSLDPPPASVVAGSLITLTGSGFTAGEELVNAPPLDRFIGGLTVWLGEVKMAIRRAGPNFVELQVPWETPPGMPHWLIETGNLNSPFAPPPSPYATITAMGPRITVALHEDWSSRVALWSPAQPGEIVHLMATGLGAVEPPVATGVPAPSSDPLARLVDGITCQGAETIYAGLAPGTYGRYQIDVRIGPEATTLRCGFASGLALPVPYN